MHNSNWICCQIGAREHYAVARALSRQGVLKRLVTDAWVQPGSLLSRGSRRLSERFHPDLGLVPVSAWNLRSIVNDVRSKLIGSSGWNRTIFRNQWFQTMAVGTLTKALPSLDGSKPVVFSYSYSALEQFRWAKRHGLRTVLGQIDGGVEDERLMERLHCRNPNRLNEWTNAPPRYWRDWRDECELADRIIVNSEWAQTLLVTAGIPSDRIRILPLVYTPPSEAIGFSRTYPESFSKIRPLRVLFLGQVSRRKGVCEVLEAAAMMESDPVEFLIVGPNLIQTTLSDRPKPNVRWMGSVTRAAAADWYRQADIFLFPSHSDGFGLTQLEARAWKLPTIASRFCGNVVSDGRNGILLQDVTGTALFDAIRSLLRNPDKLIEMSRNCRFRDTDPLTSLGSDLIEAIG